jgi:dTDP-4-dehydrorhamnose reductase
MNILIFGKDGQLGKAFKALFDTFEQSSKKTFNVSYAGRAECDLENIASIEALLSTLKPTLIINAAAYTSVDKAEEQSALAFAINTKAPEAMALYAAKHGATLLHYSTDYVFDGEKYGFYLEDDKRNPLGAYGRSKADGEDAIANIFHSNNAGQYAIFRTSWVYGDGENFIRTILRLAKDRKELKVIHDQHGVPTNATWLAKVSIDLVLDKALCIRTFPSGIYHAVPQGEATWHELAYLAVDTAINAGLKLQLSPKDIHPIPAADYPLPAPRPMNSRMASDKLYKALEKTGDMSKLQHFTKHWTEDVQAYVHHLVQTRDI